MKSIFLVSIFISCLPTWAQIEPDKVFPRLLTHIPKFEQGFEATLMLKNESKLIKEIYFNCFNEQGEVINQGEPLRFRLDPGTTQIISGNAMLPPGTSHATVVGSSRVRVSVMYGQENRQDGSKALLHETQQAGTKFVIYPTGGDPAQGYWEGLALINLASQETQVSFSIKDSNGNLLEQTDRSVGPMAKLTTTLSGLFQDSSEMKGNQIEVTSSASVSMVMLSGNSQRKDFTNVSPEKLADLEPLRLTEDIESLPKKILSFDEIIFEEEVLTVSAVLPNPCHDLELYWTGAVKESYPLQVDLYVVARDVTDICFQPLTKKTRSFDLTRLSEALGDPATEIGETLIVNLRDKDHGEIIMVYNFVPFQ